LKTTTEIKVILRLLDAIIQINCIGTRSKIKSVAEEAVELAKFTGD
jgi:hypothetical protein